MVIKQLAFGEQVKKMIVPELLQFFKPRNGLLYRVYGVPKIDYPAKEKEIREVLNTLCISYRDNVWYFRFRQDSELDEIFEIFVHMGLFPMAIELESNRELLN